MLSSVVFRPSSGDISHSSKFVTVSELFSGEVLDIFVILSAILLLIESTVASAFFFELLFYTLIVILTSN